MDKKYRYHFLAVLGHDPPENQSLATISGKKRGVEGGEGDLVDSDDEMGSGGEEEGGMLLMTLCSYRIAANFRELAKMKISLRKLLWNSLTNLHGCGH